MTHSTGIILFVTCIFFFVRCEHSNDNQLVIWQENAVVRKEPDDRSDALQMLQRGQRVQDMEETASNESVFFIKDSLCQSPWIKIEMPDGRSGWMLAWYVKPMQEDKAWLLKKRIDTYWGKGLRLEWDHLLKELQSVKNQEDWFLAWRSALSLRDTMMLVLHNKPLNEDELSFQWMAGLLPGFILQESSIAGKPYLFADYRFWLGKAIQSTGSQDDALARYYCTLFPEDSIESAYPVWLFQLGETAFASQLGLGRHDLNLRRMDTLLSEAPLASREISTLKNQILEDILDHERTYWQASDKIQQELQGLLLHPPASLSTAEVEAISIRAKMFRQPELHGIRVNMRSGK